jgi:hypothetical protein
MFLSEIKEYNHKINKLEITNNNKASVNNYVIAKFTLDNIPANTTVRFSFNENSDYIPHQQIGNDFFMQIPNELNSVSYIYVHYFLKELYTYDGDKIVHVNLDLNTLFNSNNKGGTNYSLSMNDKNLRIDYVLNNGNKQIVRDPNWKDCVLGDKETQNMTEKGEYPLDSKFRNTFHFFDIPNLDSNNLYRWKVTDTSSIAKYNIKLDAINISSYVIDKNDPLNIYMQYRYLPSSSKSHEHYIGMIGEEKDTDSLLLHGDNLNMVNEHFSNNTHRLIYRDYPTDENTAFRLNKENDIGFIFNPLPYKINNKDCCEIIKDGCDDYYKIKYNGYNDKPNKGYQKITLNPDYNYTLSYYIYLPHNTDVNNIGNYYYLEIDGNKPDSTFLDNDKKFNGQWHYHEINFKPKQENVVLDIYGPYDLDIENPMFLYNIILTKDPIYNPLIKYNRTSMIVQEESSSVSQHLVGSYAKKNLENAEETYTPKINIPVPFIDAYSIPDMSNCVSHFLGRQLEPPTSAQSANKDEGVYCATDKCLYKFDGSNWIKTTLDFSKMLNAINIHTLNTSEQVINSGNVTISVIDKSNNVVCQPITASIKSNGLCTSFLNFSELQKDSEYYLVMEYNDPICSNRQSKSEILIKVIEPNITITPYLDDTVLPNSSNLSTWSIPYQNFNINVTVVDSISNINITAGSMNLEIGDKLIQSTLSNDKNTYQFFINVTNENLSSGSYTFEFNYINENTKITKTKNVTIV